MLFFLSFFLFQIKIPANYFRFLLLDENSNLLILVSLVRLPRHEGVSSSPRLSFKNTANSLLTSEFVNRDSLRSFASLVSGGNILLKLDTCIYSNFLFVRKRYAKEEKQTTRTRF